MSGKWVIVMRGGPEQIHPHSIYASHASLNQKMMVARDFGASGIIFVSQESDAGLVAFGHSTSQSKGSIPAIHLSNEMANQLFRPHGHSIASIQEKNGYILKVCSV